MQTSHTCMWIGTYFEVVKKKFSMKCADWQLRKDLVGIANKLQGVLKQCCWCPLESRHCVQSCATRNHRMKHRHFRINERSIQQETVKITLKHTPCSEHR